MSDRVLAAAIPVLLAGVAVALGVALVGAARPRPAATTVHLIAPPMAIFDAQGQVWLEGAAPSAGPGHGPPPPGSGAARDRGRGPGADGDRRAMALRARVAELAAAIGDELTPAQQAEIVARRDELSARYGELRAWEELTALLPAAPAAPAEEP